MKTKFIITNNGNGVFLFFLENKRKWTLDFNKAYKDRSNFSILEESDDNPFKDKGITNNAINSVLRYYNNLSEKNKSKIRKMINIDINNINTLHKIVLEREEYVFNNRSKF